MPITSAAEHYLAQGYLGFRSVVTPACSLHNFGNVTETYPVLMRIGSTYSQM